MGKKCLKCAYERQTSDSTSNDACPNCGAIYAKVEAAVEGKRTPARPSPHQAGSSSEWDRIRVLAIVTALYTIVFMLKLGEPDQVWWWFIAVVFFGWLYCPYLLLLQFATKHLEHASALRIVFITMLINSVTGLFISYDASVTAQTDAGGAMMFAVLPMYQLAVSAIGLKFATSRTTRT